jgi:hypothetical protein
MEETSITFEVTVICKTLCWYYSDAD